MKARVAAGEHERSDHHDHGGRHRRARVSGPGGGRLAARARLARGLAGRARRHGSARWCPQHGYEDGLGALRRRCAARACCAPLLLPLDLLRRLLAGARAIFAHRPDVVLGMGGYITFPGGMMAALLGAAAGDPRAEFGRRPGQQGAGAAGRPRAAGVSRTRCKKRELDRQSGARRHRRAAAPARALSRARTGRCTLLVVGGSLGAQALNETVPQALALLPGASGPRSRTSRARSISRRCARPMRAPASRPNASPSSTTWRARYAEADVVICRAGALTVAELAAAGVASIWCRFPHAVDDHQTAQCAIPRQRGRGDPAAAGRTDAASGSGRCCASLTRERLLEMAEKARARSAAARCDAAWSPTR